MGTLLASVLIVFFVLKRMDPLGGGVRRFIGTLAFAATTGVFTIHALWDYVRENFSEFAVAYVVVCATCSLAITHWALKRGGDGVKGGIGVSVAVQDIARWGIRIFGAACVYFASSSATVSMYQLAAVILWIFVVQPTMRQILGFVQEFQDARHVPPPPRNNYLTHKYLTKEQYEMEGKIQTDKSVTALIKSPAFARWARENHDRIHITPRKGGLFWDDDAKDDDAFDTDSE